MENLQKPIYQHELTEQSFDRFLPAYLKTASRLYFTPIEVAKKAAEWLTETNASRILDIGAGTGKFCITGAKYSDSHFYGVEHRESLAKTGNTIAQHFGLNNVSIFHANILDISFSEYDAFYLFNPFYENLEFVKRLNDEVELEENMYQVYLNHTEEQLDKAQAGTRLVTYHGNNFEVPNSYKKETEAFNGELKLWIKQEKNDHE
ncbi:MAG: class I SAM-dependent methyltransferase [Burkholderiales bacterium]|nr:class I SAM-dependent methyltransferase [Bacteroidia bacterium]